MDGLWHAMAASFGLGALYFIGAVPAGMALGLHAAAAGFAAWAGYAAITALTTALGAPAREWIARRFGLQAKPDPNKVFWRAWKRGGLPGIALLAPVTVGPCTAALVALSLGEKPRGVFAWIVLAALPWAIVFAIAGMVGLSLIGGVRQGSL